MTTRSNACRSGEGQRGRRRRGAARHDPEAPAVAATDLSVAYDGRVALDSVTLTLPAGRSLAVVGPNGAGKSTLLKTIAGLLAPTSGTLDVHGHGPCRHLCIAYVPQRSAVDWRFPVTVEDVVLMGRSGRLGPLRRPGPPDREAVRRSLAAVNLTGHAETRIDALSGGQQQRMFLARALVQEAQLLLLDEPFTGLDLPSREAVLSLLGEAPLTGLTRIVAMHDLGAAADHFEALALLNTELIAFGEPAAILKPDVLRRAYGSCARVVRADGETVIVSDTACGGGIELDLG
jgi:ABC-type Mn2+/Zn2+ transport system ATPase subunit